MVPEPPEKTLFVIVIDFVLGAIFADVIVSIYWMRAAARANLLNSHSYWTVLLGTTLTAGALNGLFRNQFWSAFFQTNSMIPPIEEAVSKPCKIVLWVIFVFGCASLGLFFVW
jgi:hypothetical protein